MKQTNAARAIQRVYRSRLRRLYGSVMVTAILAEKRLHFKAATAINKVARGRLDRRRAKTERYGGLLHFTSLQYFTLIYTLLYLTLLSFTLHCFYLTSLHFTSLPITIFYLLMCIYL